jgi:hypothetical protein
VTPAPGVHSIQAQNPADGILLSACSERLTLRKDALRIFSFFFSFDLSVGAGVTPAAHRAGDLVGSVGYDAFRLPRAIVELKV